MGYLQNQTTKINIMKKNQFMQAIKCCLTNGKFALLLFCSFIISCKSTQEINSTTNPKNETILNTEPLDEKITLSNEDRELCLTNHLGNIEITNNTNNVIYFYYSNMTRNFGKQIQAITIQAGSKKPIKNLVTKMNINSNETTINYKWVVSYENFTDLNEYGKHDYLKKIIGFETGNIYLKDCETEKIEINR